VTKFATAFSFLTQCLFSQSDRRVTLSCCVRIVFGIVSAGIGILSIRRRQNRGIPSLAAWSCTEGQLVLRPRINGQRVPGELYCRELPPDILSAARGIATVIDLWKTFLFALRVLKSELFPRIYPTLS
jgi:hypothetical protein